MFPARARLLLSIAAALALVGVFFLQARPSPASPEVHFADASPSGLQIVPASCPSPEHWQGECSTTANACTLSVTPTSMTAGSQSTVSLSWNTGPLSGYDESQYSIKGVINAIGNVYQYGTLAVTAPSFSTTYTYNGGYYDLANTLIQKFSCAATLTVTGGANPLYINAVELFRTPGSTVATGDIISYRLYLANNSQTQTQTNMRITDAVPSYTTLTWQGGGANTYSASIAGFTGSLWWLENSAVPGWSGYVDFNVQVNSSAPNGASICNTASVLSDQNSSVNSNQICNTVSTPFCPYYLDPSEDYGGYKLFRGTSGRQINKNTTPICVSNGSGFSYFVPAKTAAEINSFKNAPPAGISIVQVSSAAVSLTATDSKTGASAASGGTLTVNVGDSLNYTWSSTGGVSATSSYSGAPAACGSAPWSANSLSGSSSGNVVASGSAGCTDVITYTVSNLIGQKTSATLTVVVRALPTAALSFSNTAPAIGSTDTVTWSSTNAASYTNSGEVKCSNPISDNTFTPIPWFGALTSTSNTITIDSANFNPNCSYIYTYIVKDSAGTASAPAKVTLTPVAAPPPSAILTIKDNTTGASAGSGGILSAKLGDSVTFSWSASASAASYTASGVVACPGSSTTYNVSDKIGALPSGSYNPVYTFTNFTPSCTYAYTYIVKDSAGTASAAQTVTLAPPCGTIPANVSLIPGQSFTSCGGGYRLAFQTDGNVVLYTSGGQVVWATNTSGDTNAAQLIMQGDGNLILYNKDNSAPWASDRFGGLTGSSGHLVVQDSGALWVVRDSDGYVMWKNEPFTASVYDPTYGYEITSYANNYTIYVYGGPSGSSFQGDYVTYATNPYPAGGYGFYACTSVCSGWAYWSPVSGYVDSSQKGLTYWLNYGANNWPGGPLNKTLTIVVY